MSESGDVVRYAEILVFRAQLDLLAEAALGRLRDRAGLTLAPLVALTHGVQVVALDGRYLGRVRIDDREGRPERWMARPVWSARSYGPYGSMQAAAEALTRLSKP